MWTENKVLVTLYVPLIEKKYEVFLPIGKKIEEIIYLLSKAIVDISNNEYQLRGDEQLYNRLSGQEYRTGLLYSSGIRYGSQLVFI